MGLEKSYLFFRRSRTRESTTNNYWILPVKVENCNDKNFAQWILPVGHVCMNDTRCIIDNALVEYNCTDRCGIHVVRSVGILHVSTKIEPQQHFMHCEILLDFFSLKWKNFVVYEVYRIRVKTNPCYFIDLQRPSFIFFHILKGTKLCY